MISPRALAFSTRIYALLLRAYPPGFRRRYAYEMAQVFRDLSQETYRWQGAAGLLRLCLPALFDLGWAVTHQWILLIFGKGGRSMLAESLNRQAADLVWCLQTGLRAAYTLREVVEVMAEHAPDPSAAACKRLLAVIDSSADFEAAVLAWKKEIELPALARMADLIISQHKNGGSLEALLGSLGEELLQQGCSDPAFYGFIRETAIQLGAQIPERAKQTI